MPQPSALKVVQAVGYQGNNYNPQGNNYNPQSGNHNPQGNNANPQANNYNPQPAYAAVPGVRRPTPAQIQAAALAAQQAADEVRRRVEAEAARQREILRRQKQLEVDTKVGQKRSQLRLSVQPARQYLEFLGRSKVKTPEIVDLRDEYQKMRDRAFANARRAFYDRSKGGWLDSITGGSQNAARKWAQDQLRDISDRQVPQYSTRLDTFLSEQARRRQAIETAKFGTQAEFDRAVTEYTVWESSEIAALESTRAQIEGMYDAYNQFASSEINAFLPNVGKAFNRLAATPVGNVLGNVWKYTLGSGSATVPSLVTAPSRAINYLGNRLDPNRQIYKSDGTAQKISDSKNAWTATFGQRNFNIAPPKKITFDQWLDSRTTTDKSGKKTMRQWLESLPADKRKSQEDKFKKLYEGENRQQQFANTALEFFADPLLAVGWLKSANIPKAVGKSAFVQRFAASAPVKTASNFVDELANSKIVKWLGSEAKSPQQKFVDAIQNAKALRAEAQSILPRVAALRAKIDGAGKQTLDYGVFDDLASLTDREAKLLQKMVGGKLSKVHWFQRGRIFDPVTREKLERIADRYKKFTDQLAAADNITAANSRFFGSDAPQYFARTNWIKTKKGQTLDAYDFRVKKTKPNYIQRADDLAASQVDRLFKSELEQMVARTGGMAKSRAEAELTELLQRYDKTMDSARADVEAAFAKTKTPYGRLRGFLDKTSPVSLWKKSVLKYRPAWYVNNFLYNTQGAALAGGGRAFAEQIRLMRPRNLRQAVDELPTGVAADVASELGRGRLSKFAGNLENLSRVAAFRALKQKGLSDAEALKRVDKYLFNYKTKNWERPLKAVVPFWAWQKNLVRASAQMPFDRPLAAKGYNQLDEHQKSQVNADFDKIVPQLREYGYSDEEIEKMRAENLEIFGNRLKVGGRYITTPFNPFSEFGIGNLGLNPYLEALGEYGSARDKFGRSLSGRDAGFFERVLQKFPQASIGRKMLDRFSWRGTRAKPTERWIGEKGSQGYGLTKEAQGFDPSKSNYKESLDKTRKLGQDISAFFGAPRGMKFDVDKLLERKKMEKLKAEYFSTDWNSMDFPAQEVARGQLFAKYGVSADEFYKGELSKYDSESTKRVKAMKEDARVKTRDLFAEYNRQPKGTRNVWATQKLRELVDSGYFATNPFLKTFDWTNPQTIAKAYKKIDYDNAKISGDWSSYRSKYGSRQGSFSYNGKFFKSSGSMQRYKNHEFWQKYFSLSDQSARRQLLRDNPSFARTAVKSEAEIAEAEFWRKYALASKSDRRQLLAANPQYNRRSDWTQAMWDEWKKVQKAEQKQKLSTVGNFLALYMDARAKNTRSASVVWAKKSRSKNKRLAYLNR